jgi:predicted permease
MASARELFVDLATNPIIISILLALAIRFTGWQLPEVGDESLRIISQATLPCVLVAVGLGLSSFELKGEMRMILVIAALKVVAMPLLAWYIGTAYLNLPAIDLAVVVFLCAMPVGANAIVFAVRNGNGEASVSGAVAISTLLAPITISATLAALA